MPNLDVNKVAKYYAQNPEELSQLIYKLGLLIGDGNNASDFEFEASGSYWDTEKELKAKLVGEIE